MELSLHYIASYPNPDLFSTRPSHVLPMSDTNRPKFGTTHASTAVARTTPARRALRSLAYDGDCRLSHLNSNTSHTGTILAGITRGYGQNGGRTGCLCIVSVEFRGRRLSFVRRWLVFSTLDKTHLRRVVKGEIQIFNTAVATTAILYCSALSVG